MCWCMGVILVHDMREPANIHHQMLVVFFCWIFMVNCFRICNFPSQIVLIHLVLGGNHVLTSRWRTM